MIHGTFEYHEYDFDFEQYMILKDVACMCNVNDRLLENSLRDLTTFNKFAISLWSLQTFSYSIFDSTTFRVVTN